MNDKHLAGLTEAQKRLTKAYAITIIGEVRTLDDVLQVDLKPYVKLEIAEREIAHLTK